MVFFLLMSVLFKNAVGQIDKFNKYDKKYTQNIKERILKFVTFNVKPLVNGELRNV